MNKTVATKNDDLSLNRDLLVSDRVKTDAGSFESLDSFKFFSQENQFDIAKNFQNSKKLKFLENLEFRKNF